jgi:NAD(P)-dependent dehydrogenase (short-subunit alcohol dehydrogenase family)
MTSATVDRDLAGKVALVTGATSGIGRPSQCNWARRGLP